MKHHKPQSLRFAAIMATLLFTSSVNAQTAPEASISKPALRHTLITNARVFDGKSENLTEYTNVLIEENKIARISKLPIEPAPGAVVIDAKGRTLMPGLIDNHVHIVMSASSQHDLMDPKVPSETLQSRGIDEAKQILLRGFTSARDLGGPIFEVKKVIDQGKFPGPRIYPSGAMISQTSGHGDSRLPHERSRRFGGEISRGELLGATLLPMGETRC